MITLFYSAFRCWVQSNKWQSNVWSYICRGKFWSISVTITLYFKQPLLLWHLSICTRSTYIIAYTVRTWRKFRIKFSHSLLIIDNTFLVYLDIEDFIFLSNLRRKLIYAGAVHFIESINNWITNDNTLPIRHFKWIYIVKCTAPAEYNKLLERILIFKRVENVRSTSPLTDCHAFKFDVSARNIQITCPPIIIASIDRAHYYFVCKKSDPNLMLF